MDTIKRLLITPGEPAGIGPDVVIQIAQQSWPHELVVVADPLLLLDRAKHYQLPLELIPADHLSPPTPQRAGTLKILPIHVETPVTPGQLDKKNSPYVMRTLETAAAWCQKKWGSAIVTGPVHKAIMNEAGIAFTGHTEFFAAYCGVQQTVMLFVVDTLKVALVTTHLPLSQVPKALTKTHLENTLVILQDNLIKYFGITSPRVFVCGLNPHAGENGYLGNEEIHIISPVLEKLRQQNYLLEGPLSADTIFTPKYMKKADAIVAMFHDQALPLIKYIGFGHAVNMTLGLPFIRTSVDHGTALDAARESTADAGSMHAAITLAGSLQDSHR